MAVLVPTWSARAISRMPLPLRLISAMRSLTPAPYESDEMHDLCLYPFVYGCNASFSR